MRIDDIDYKRFDKLDILAKQVVEGFIIGLHKSPYHGFSVEFAEYRNYNPGDSVRSIDWKAYAKTKRMYIKKYEEETNLRCQMVIDVSSSMQFPKYLNSDKLNKLQFAAISTAVLNYMLSKQRDAIGLSLVADEIELHTPTKMNAMHHKMINNYLYQLLTDKQPEHKQTHLPHCIHQIAEMLHKRSLVIIFSDFLSSTEEMGEFFKSIQHLKHQKHEVIVFHVHSKREEQELVFENRPYQFVDLESGETVKLLPHQVKDFYRDKMNGYMGQIRAKLSQYQVDWVEADIEEGFEKILQTYLVKRSKMKIG